MNEFTSFYGEIVGTNDLDFLNDGIRAGIVQTHNTITNNSGGIVNGLSVSISLDKSTLIVSPGIFYTSGPYSQNNNAGGGERGQLYVQQTFTNLPATPPIGTTPQYLLVYAKITTTNTDPNPLNSNVTVTSINLQTGESVPTREYANAVIVVTNPGFKSALAAVQGVPLVWIQVDYIGTAQVSSNGSIQFYDPSVAKNYTIGNTLDVNKGLIVDDGIGLHGVPNNFLTNRMYAPDSITGDKFTDNSIGTSKIAVWDGITAYNDTIEGSGITNQQLKGQAVTTDKLNYSQSMNGFGNRNLLLNSSFEIFSGTSISIPASWNLTNALGTNTTITTYANDNKAPKFGNNAIYMFGNIDGNLNPLNLTMSQTISSTSFNGLPISAFFWAQEVTPTNFSYSGNTGGTPTTGLIGQIDFLTSTPSSPPLQTVYFGPVPSGTNGYQQYATSGTVIYSGATQCTQLRLTIGGKFNGSYYVDGAWLGVSNLIPEFDVSPSEYVSLGLNFNQIIGTVGPGQFATNSIPTGVLQSNSVNTSNILDGSITSQKIAQNTITGGPTGNIQEGTITATELSPSLIFGVPSGFIIFTDNASKTCPPGFTDVTSVWSGRFPLGVNPSSTQTSVSTIGQNNGTPVIDASAATGIENQKHVHSLPGGTNGTGGSADDVPTNGQTTGSDSVDHSHPLPFRTVRFCQAD